ncbi:MULTISPECIES: hypothetical protein [Kytococcus]|uniref:hypothetical protein n=1 Tax=Kytococcus TaxID=57499 RepID=UPI0008A35EAE|nr:MULTISPECIES: hypothetical protein [Kytococcus]OFS15797.1 hypothetical protein HMPREF3099_01155 [Kytococcus sp. HMSC28H12]
MGSIPVDQILPSGERVLAPDTTLSESAKNRLLLDALPGAEAAVYAGDRVVRFRDQVLLKKQITHLGRPWPEFKKRIQIPPRWLDVAAQAASEGLTVRFVGIYNYGDVTVFVDFEPEKYLLRAANNSAAHLATNDLFQAQTEGVFTREDSNGNRLTSVRADLFLDYLTGGVDEQDPRIEVFERFNGELLTGRRMEALDAIREMHADRWPDTFQGEWPGFYLEYRFDQFIRATGLAHRVAFQKMKTKGEFDFDLVFPASDQIDFYGDLKASNITSREAPGNDMADLLRCIQEYGRFWYVLYEHETWHAKNRQNLATIEWNEWKRSVGKVAPKGYDKLSYAGRFKEAVRFQRMHVLELNEANLNVVLGEFHQGCQPDGSTRAMKCMIRKRNIDNFRIFHGEAPEPTGV